MKVRLVPLATLPKLEFSWNFNLLTTDKEISKRHYNDLGTWHDGRIRPDVKYVFKHKCFEYKSRNHVVLCRVIKPCRLECGKQPLWTHMLQIRVQSTCDKFHHCGNLTSLSWFSLCKTTSAGSLFVTGMKPFFLVSVNICASESEIYWVSGRKVPKGLCVLNIVLYQFIYDLQKVLEVNS